MAGVKECNHEVSSALKSGLSPASFLSSPRYRESKRPTVNPLSRSNSFQKKEIPSELQEIRGKRGEFLGEFLVENKILSSKSEWRRMVLSKAIHDLEKDNNITDANLKITEDLTLKIGKKRFLKITVK